MNLPMMKEKMATPNSSIIEQTSRSTLVLGKKSPNPTVDSEVIAKYTDMMHTFVGLIRCSPLNEI